MTISTTPNRGYPWPDNAEPLTNGWDAIRDLAVAVDTDVDALADAAAARVVGWTDYDPRYGATSPIMLSANLRARYSVRDKLCEVQISGTYYPQTAGVYKWLLPVAHVAGHSVPLCVGTAWAYDISTSQRYQGAVVIPSGAGHVEVWTSGTNPWSDQGGATAPFAWAASNDQVSLSFRYEVA
jgi:hypothetical protein